jgi:6-phosphogluconate dehydrogenase
MNQPTFGLTGLAVMGQNLARNVARKGIAIAVHNRTAETTHEFLKTHGHEGTFVGADDLASFVAAIRPPRAIMMMVKAGKPVDDVIEGIKPHLDKGDLLIDGGNSFFKDTARRAAALEAEGYLYIGTGVSGGEEGALNGPAIMPGGRREAYDRVAPVLTAIAAHVDGAPCCAYIGEGGAGHYVKMVHNGIEYADMQLISEAYDLLKSAVGLSNEEIGRAFGEWNDGELGSYLIEITADIFRTRDPETGGFLVDAVLDRAGQKGTGKWTSDSALELGSPVTAITEAVFARYLSAMKAERTAASRVLAGPASRFGGTAADWVGAVRDALYASKVIAYAQGFDLMRVADAEYGWNLKPGEIATIWRGGCIIRARFLSRIKEAYDADPGLRNLLLAPFFQEIVGRTQGNWRRIVSAAAQSGVPVPAFSAALAYYDGYRRERLPANLIQAQRDLFGAHTYERTDREGVFHSRWGA